MKLTTGIGYVKDSEDNIVSKFHFSPNSEHDFGSDVTVVEVENLDELNTFEIFSAPAAPEDVEDQMIQVEIESQLRSDAIERLKVKGKLPPEYKDKKKKQGE